MTTAMGVYEGMEADEKSTSGTTRSHFSMHSWRVVHHGR